MLTYPPQDLEEIEEWNEYGELRMQIESVEDFGDSLPATSYPATSAATTSSAAAPAPAPKQSTIKIQNPPSKEEHKETSIPPALRQAGEEAAAKAKQSSSSPAPAAPAPVASTPTAPTSAAAADEKSEESASKVQQSSPAPAAPADTTPAAPTTAAAGDEKSEESKQSEEEPNRTAQVAPSDAQTTTAAAESEKGTAESTTVRREKSSVAPEINSSSSLKGGAQSTPAEAGGEAVGEEAVGRGEAGREGESKGGMGVFRPQRPRLVPEMAAESTANFHADSAQALGLVQHHRGSIVSATSPEEKQKVAQDLRTSVSGAQADVVESLRAEKATREKEGEHEETIEEEPAGVDEMAARVQETRI